MTVAVLVPWKPGCAWREKAWAWVQDRFAENHPTWEIVTGTTDVEGFSRTQAILDARSKTAADVLVITDADVWCDGLTAAVEHAERSGWAIPHLLLHRLAESSTLRVLDGADWRGEQLSDDNRQDSRPYRGHEAGTLLVCTAAAFDLAPPDPRFIGWGQEDAAWAAALHTMIGSPWRGRADLFHLWHPPEPRRTRIQGNPANVALGRRYSRARRHRDRMVDLIEEGRAMATRVVLNRRNIRALLRSESVRADLERRAENIAEVAGPGHVVDSDIGRNRARAAVITATYEARLAEAQTRNLTRAFSAGRF